MGSDPSWEMDLVKNIKIKKKTKQNRSCRWEKCEWEKCESNEKNVGQQWVAEETTRNKLSWRNTVQLFFNAKHANFHFFFNDPLQFFPWMWWRRFYVPMHMVVERISCPKPFNLPAHKYDFLNSIYSLGVYGTKKFGATDFTSREAAGDTSRRRYPRTQSKRGTAFSLPEAYRVSINQAGFEPDFRNSLSMRRYTLLFCEGKKFIGQWIAQKNTVQKDAKNIFH